MSEGKSPVGGRVLVGLLLGAMVAIGVAGGLFEYHVAQQVKDLRDLAAKFDIKAQRVRELAPHSLTQTSSLSSAIDEVTTIVSELNQGAREVRDNGFRARPDYVTAIRAQIHSAKGALNSTKAQWLYRLRGHAPQNLQVLLQSLTEAYNEATVLEGSVRCLQDLSQERPTNNFFVNRRIKKHSMIPTASADAPELNPPCGAPGREPSGISPELWCGYTCRAGSLEEGCFKKGTYGPKSQCPGESGVRCCPPMP